MVWHDQGFALRECPLRHYTAEVREVLFWFEHLYDIAVDFGGVRWVRTGLPGPGSVGEQDAWLMAALAYFADTMNTLSRREDARGAKAPGKDGTHGRAERQRHHPGA